MTRLMNIVFDIDDVLCCTELYSDQQERFFENKGAIITAIKTHYVFPGVIELMQLLFATDHVRVSFFSSGTHERNEPFVKELLVRSLGEVRYEQIRKDVTVLSRRDLVIQSDNEQKTQWETYHIGGHERKDLSKVLRDGELLCNTVLIDDSRSYVKCGQEANLLQVSRTEKYEYLDSDRQFEHYNNEGLRNIPCYFYDYTDDTKLPNRDKTTVTNAKCIDVLGLKTGYQVAFLNEHGAYEQREMPPSLISIKDDLEINEYVVKILGATANKVRAVVQSYGGVTTKMCRKINRISYITGLLFKAMEAAIEGDIPITEVLFEWQGKLKQEPDKLLENKLNYYHYGLKKLREVSSEFSFVSPKIHHETIQQAVD